MTYGRVLVTLDYNKKLTKVTEKNFDILFKVFLLYSNTDCNGGIHNNKEKSTEVPIVTIMS